MARDKKYSHLLAAGMLISPDIVNQAPDYSQAYNRYSYCLNNPLNMVDLNGYTYQEDENYWEAEGCYGGCWTGKQLW